MQWTVGVSPQGSCIVIEIRFQTECRCRSAVLVRRTGDEQGCGNGSQDLVTGPQRLQPWRHNGRQTLATAGLAMQKWRKAVLEWWSTLFPVRSNTSVNVYAMCFVTLFFLFYFIFIFLNNESFDGSSFEKLNKKYADTIRCLRCSVRDLHCKRLLLLRFPS